MLVVRNFWVVITYTPEGASDLECCEHETLSFLELVFLVVLADQVGESWTGDVSNLFRNSRGGSSQGSSPASKTPTRNLVTIKPAEDLVKPSQG